MKLPPLRNLVKPDTHVLTAAAISTLATLGAVLVILAATDHRRERMDRFGNATATALAELSVEPLMRQDRMHLGVIGNRLAAMPEIDGIASYSADDRLLAATGDANGPQYSAPVSIDGNVVGYVRVTLHAPAFAEANPGRALWLLAVALFAPLTVVAGWSLTDALKRGEMTVAVPWWPRSGARPDAGHELATGGGPMAAGAAAQTPAAEVSHYLLAVNLYNQLTLEPRQREFEQSLCMELADKVADIYHGQVVSLPGVGTLVDFDHSADEDRPFQVVCAAFLLTRLLSREAPFGQYRLGLNMTRCPADATLPSDDPTVADAALLSALGKNGTLAVSAPLAHVLQGGGRLTSRRLASPVLDQLSAGGADCILITALDAPFAARVAAEADQLETERDTTSNPSTF